MLARVFHDAPEPVFDDAARSRTATELFVESQLHAFLATVFNVGKSDHMRNGFALGILALVFLALVNAFDTQCSYFLRHGIINLALDPDKVFVFIGQFFVQLCNRHFQQPGQLNQLRFGGIDVFRNCPNAWRGDAGRQNQTIAVQNTAAIGGQFQRAGKPHFTLSLIKIIAQHLDVDSAAS